MREDGYQESLTLTQFFTEITGGTPGKRDAIMTKAELLRMISRLSHLIGFLEGKWARPRSNAETAIIQSLFEMRETVHKAYETMKEEEEQAS